MGISDIPIPINLSGVEVLLDFSILIDNFDMYWYGFKITITASVIALILSFFIGAIIAVMRITTIAPLRWIGTAYVEFFRNIPLVIIAFFFFVGTPVNRFKVFGTHGRDDCADYLHICIYCRSDSIRYISCTERANGSRKVIGTKLYPNDEDDYLTSGNKDCYSTYW